MTRARALSVTRQVTLVIASDGLWDVWPYKDVLKYPLEATAPGKTRDGAPVSVDAVAERLSALLSETRAESAEMFGESADNITAVCVAFDRIELAD